MESNPRYASVTFNRENVRLASFVLFILKIGIGTAVLMCGLTAVAYTRNQDTYGPPYFVGAFLAGSPLVMSSLFAILVYRRSERLDPQSASERKGFRAMVLAEVVFAISAVLGSLLGLFFVIWGVKGCDNPHSFVHTCNYTRNIELNRVVAWAILVCLLLTLIVGLLTIYFACCSAMYRGFRGTRRGRVIRANYDPIAVQTTQGLGGAAQQMYVYPTATVGGVQHQEQGLRMRNLEEENRLLRQQLQLRHQQQQQQRHHQQCNDEAQPSTCTDTDGLPPSYNECVSRPPKLEPMHGQGPATYSSYPHKPSAPPV